MLDECAQTLVFHCVVKGFLIILNVILIIYLIVQVMELQRGTENIKDDVKFVFDAVENLVRKLSKLHIHSPVCSP